MSLLARIRKVYVRFEYRTKVVFVRLIESLTQSSCASILPLWKKKNTLGNFQLRFFFVCVFYKGKSTVTYLDGSGPEQQEALGVNVFRY